MEIFKANLLAFEPSLIIMFSLASLVISFDGKRLFVRVAHGCLDDRALAANLIVRLSMKDFGFGIPSPPSLLSINTLAAEKVFLLGKRKSRMMASI